MNIRGACVAVLVGLSTACSSGSSNNNDNSDPGNSSFEGTYNLTAVTSTETDINGGTCGDGAGSMVITGSVISGSILSTNGLLFDLSGNVSSSGAVTGGFAQGEEISATYEGTFAAGSGSGTWTDVFECTGTWAASSGT